MHICSVHFLFSHSEEKCIQYQNADITRASGFSHQHEKKRDLEKILGVISLVAISTNTNFTSLLFEMINDVAEVVLVGSKGKPFGFSTGISKKCGINS